MASQDIRTIAITSYGHGLCHMAELAYSAVIPAVMVEYAIEAPQAAALGIPGIMMFGMAAPIAGMWADRRGYREAFLGYYLLVAITATFVAVAPRSPSVLMVGLTLLGISISIYHPVGMAMLSHCGNTGRAMGINGVAGSIGIAVGPAFAILVGAWRWTYGLIACCAVAGFVMTLFSQNNDSQLAESKADEKSRLEGNDAASQRNHAAILITLLFLAVAIGGFNYRNLMTALPSFLNGSTVAPVADEVARGSAKGALAVFVVLAMGGVGQIVGGYLADRFVPSRLYVGTILCSVPAAFMLSRSSGAMSAVFASMLSVFMFAQQPLENTIIANVTPPRLRSTVYGLKFILAFGVASSGMYVAGRIWRDFGIQQVFAFFALMAMLMSALALIFAIAYSRLQRDSIQLKQS
ncbi:MAG: MFS transporter [Planctomycetales bacterium]|nr:MFS transporter [Planctomycetales bacterium]